MKTVEQGVKEQSNLRNPLEVMRTASTRPNWLVTLVAGGASVLALSSCTAVVEGHASPGHMAATATVTDPPKPKRREVAPVFRDVCSLDKTAEDHQRIASIVVVPASELSPCSSQVDKTVDIGELKSMGTWLQSNGTRYIVYIQDDEYKPGESAFETFIDMKDVTTGPIMTTYDDITLPCPWRFSTAYGNALTTIDGYNVGAYATFPNEAASSVSGAGVLQGLVFRATDLYVR